MGSQIGAVVEVAQQNVADGSKTGLHAIFRKRGQRNRVSEKQVLETNFDPRSKLGGWKCHFVDFVTAKQGPLAIWACRSQNRPLTCWIQLENG